MGHRSRKKRDRSRSREKLSESSWSEGRSNKYQDHQDHHHKGDNEHEGQQHHDHGRDNPSLSSSSRSRSGSKSPEHRSSRHSKSKHSRNRDNHLKHDKHLKHIKHLKHPKQNKKPHESKERAGGNGSERVTNISSEHQNRESRWSSSHRSSHHPRHSHPSSLTLQEKERMRKVRLAKARMVSHVHKENEEQSKQKELEKKQKELEDNAKAKKMNEKLEYNKSKNGELKNMEDVENVKNVENVENMENVENVENMKNMKDIQTSDVNDNINNNILEADTRPLIDLNRIKALPSVKKSPSEDEEEDFPILGFNKMPTTGNQPNWDNNNNSISNREGDCTCGEESGDEDPLEQYMKGIEEGEEVKKSQVISFEEIERLQQGIDSEDEVSGCQLWEDRFHEEFISMAKQKGIEREEERIDEHREFNVNEERLYGSDEDEYLLEMGEEKEQEDYLSKLRKQAEKKELKLVDHSTIEYGAFIKNFYIEPTEQRGLSEKEIRELRKKLGDIKVRGYSCPKPIENWYQGGLSDRILRILDKKNFLEPFAIQKQAIPAITNGLDVIGIAETGSGKTLAYILPMLRHVLDQPTLKDGDGPIGLVIAPTRELAYQIYKDTRVFSKVLLLKVCCVYGGAGVSGQLSELKRGAEIVICTPGRMIDILTMSNGKITNLRRVTYLCLDEADRMFDMGFEPQITRILGNIRPDRQTVMFSATFPWQIETLAKKILMNPVEILVGNRGQTCLSVTQKVHVVEETDKLTQLMQILAEFRDRGSILIFVDTQSKADNLYKELFEATYDVLVLHGGQDQTDREFTISDFRAGVKNILIATSVGSRGLDIKSIILVINYDCPNHMEDYIHRIGRTGRAGNTGLAVTFITPEQANLAAELIKAFENSALQIPHDLEELDKTFKLKVAMGEEETYRPKGYIGRGHQFNEEEREKEKKEKKEMSKSFGMQIEENIDSDDEIEIGGVTHNKSEEKSEEQMLLDLIKDPKAKQAANDAAIQAAKNAIVVGSSQEEIMASALDAIRQVVIKYKPAVTAEKGMEKAMAIADEWASKEEEKSGKFSVEIDINDYPDKARKKASHKEFSTTIYELTSTIVSCRGVYVEGGKKPPIGQKRLCLHLEGTTKQDVQNAYKEIKRVLDEISFSSLNSLTPAAYGPFQTPVD